ncbi:trypsin-like serine peptidase [Empedobacter brevis]
MKIDNLQFENLFKPIPGNNPTRVANDKIRTSPFHYVGLLIVTFPNSTLEYIGTATIIGKSKEDKESLYLLTCAHNLYSKNNGGKAVKVKFIRACNFPELPFPEVEAESWYYPDRYEKVDIPNDVPLRFLAENLIQENIDVDYGIVKLKETVRSDASLPTIEVKTDEELSNKKVQINGYGWFNEAMSHAKGELTGIQPQSLLYPISTTKGASGSAIMDQTSLDIFGVHTRETDENFNRGVRITEGVKKQILEWM